MDATNKESQITAAKPIKFDTYTYDYDDYDDYSATTGATWDPLRSADWDRQVPTLICIARIKYDISSMFRDPAPGIFISPDPMNLTIIHALIIGPSDTPYEGGFFYFAVRCPPDYPILSPRCRLMTTGNNTVRFNPNLYANGKVCLSILGTWTGPAWSAAQCLSSVLISIQSLMSENPYHNEPGYEKERQDGHSKAYNEIIQHETIRVAVCEMLENPNSCPEQLRKHMIDQFLKSYDHYVRICSQNLDKEYQQMVDPFNDQRGRFQYASILKRLEQLKSKIEIESSNQGSDDSPVNARIREIMNSTSVLYSHIPSTQNENLDNIFDEDVDME
ncbi:unnamed protein product [Adineta ricciae]|uniref:Ubiquitin-conjugating enzyme E2 Z n=1 Tax=Adineta ricciae TaxID=249248 RepID=A0A815NB38_ADIRI|nr:unnamed protein product [Adineta ricciae]